MLTRPTLLFVLLATSVGPLHAASWTTSPPTRETLVAAVAAAPCADGERWEAALAAFRAAGAEPERLTASAFDGGRNLVVHKAGSGPGRVIVGAHYDKVKPGCGAVDNWSGIVLLTQLYRQLREQPTVKSYDFVAFGAEELGRHGSIAMARELARGQRDEVCVMVNLDSFGLAATEIMTNASNRKLVNYVKALGQDFGTPVAGVDLKGADADSSSFRHRSIAAVTLTAVSPDWLKILHTDDDQAQRVDPERMAASWQLAARLLERLDGEDCQRLR